MSASCHARLKEFIPPARYPPTVVPSLPFTHPFCVLRVSVSLFPSFHLLRLATCSRRRDTAAFRHLLSCPLYIHFPFVLVINLPYPGTSCVLPNRRPGCISDQPMPPATVLLSRLSWSLLSSHPRREDCRVPCKQRQCSTIFVSTASHQYSKLLEESKR